MKKEIAVNIRGNIEALLAEWRPPSGGALDRDSNGTAGFIFSGGNLSQYAELEAAVARLALTHDLTLDAYFRCVDFTVGDLRASALLWMRVPTTPGLEVTGTTPIEVVRCDQCFRQISVLRDVDRVQLKAEEMPARPLIAAVTLKAASRELLTSLVEARLNTGLYTRPCSLTARRKTVDDAYHFIAATVDLGDPQGDIRYGSACPGCGQRDVTVNRSFLWTFARERWTGKDFCTSSFFGRDMIYVSQRVYRHLEERSTGALFEPVELR